MREPMRRDDLVRTWFDTGALGATILYGRVVAAGPRAFVVEWESGLRNRIRQGHPGITRVTGAEVTAVRAACGW